MWKLRLMAGSAALHLRADGPEGAALPAPWLPATSLMPFSPSRGAVGCVIVYEQQWGAWAAQGCRGAHSGRAPNSTPVHQQPCSRFAGFPLSQLPHVADAATVVDGGHSPGVWHTASRRQWMTRVAGSFWGVVCQGVAADDRHPLHCQGPVSTASAGACTPACMGCVLVW